MSKFDIFSAARNAVKVGVAVGSTTIKAYGASIKCAGLAESNDISGFSELVKAQAVPPTVSLPKGIDPTTGEVFCGGKLTPPESAKGKEAYTDVVCGYIHGEDRSYVYSRETAEPAGAPKKPRKAPKAEERVGVDPALTNGQTV
jgi:hypothetical protein